MKIPRARLLLFLLGPIAPQVAGGQDLTPGQRVRLTLTGDSTRTGIFDSASQEQVWLRSESAGRIPFSGVQRVELSRGRQPAWKKGLACGALAGTVVGGALWLAFINGDQEEDEIKEIFAAVLLGSGAVGGALAGAGLSLILARDRWEVVPRERWTIRLPTWQVGVRLGGY
jgi:hypothetical protein